MFFYHFSILRGLYSIDFNNIFFITFYAPLKFKINKSLNDENIINNTDFDNTFCIISGLQELWNSSKIYGQRYNSILFETFYKQEEWISIQIKYSKILELLGNDKALINQNIINVTKDNKWININEESTNKNRTSESFDLIKLKNINSYIELLIKKNNDFIYWAKFKYLEKNQYIYENNELNKIEKDNKIDQTEKEALIKSRLKQGEFREKILKEFNCCIFSKINDSRLLIASHIKPWRNCNNKERLNQNNGLLLSPMFDKLFDKGFISFGDNGELLISKDLSKDVIELLNIQEGVIYDLKLNNEKKEFIRFHRKEIFII